MQARWIVGIDEAGRGPLAGPVAVGAVCVPVNFDWALLPGVADSKTLVHTRREELYRAARLLEREKHLMCAVSKVSAPVIDRVGITRAVALGVERALKRLFVTPEEVHVKLDGLLKAPEIYTTQETIIKGDETEPAISLASILAKVDRDRYMVRMAQKYHAYGFEAHKGYGTRAHRHMLEIHGSSPIHRKSFIHQ